MRWLIFVILLFPVVLCAQVDIHQSVEKGGFCAEISNNINQGKTILLSSSNDYVLSSLTDEETKQDTIQLKNRKSPTIAFTLSLVGGATFLPGLGQHYNGEHKKGLYMGAIWLTGWFIAVGTVDRDSEKTGLAIGLPLLYGALIWSCIDAPLSAKRINKRQREQNAFHHMYEFYKGQYTLGFDIGITEKTIGPNLTLHF